MPKTAVVNPRKRRKGGKRRRKNPAASTTRRRRRRNYGAAAASSRTPNRRRRAKRSHRRRNPGRAIARRRNPGMFDMDNLIDTLPAATAGVFAARYAVQLAGPFEASTNMSGGPGVPVPGIKHAIAVYLAAQFGGKLIGDLLGSSAKGEYARIAALGFGGDMFARKRFLADNAWVNKNLSLAGVDDNTFNYSGGADLNGFQASSQLGDSFVDAVGNRYVQTAQGWALAGVGAELVQDDAGNVYALEGDNGGQFEYPRDYDQQMEDSRVGAFSRSSALGFYPVRPHGESGFGYA